MHTDARSLDDDSLIIGDICIVGAGAAGISIALQWIDTPYRVILLEAGGFEYDDQVQDLYRGKTTGQTYYPLKASRLHYFGGTTGHWNGMCSPFDPIDFVQRDWVDMSGWPIALSQLEPYYCRAHSILGLGPCNYKLGYWQKQDPTLTALPLDREVVWNKIWQFSHARFGKKYRKVLTAAKNIQLFTYATVTDILANQNGTVINQVTIKNHSNKTCRVNAKYVILACGAIQNARLLLASRSLSENGLGNDNDLVGRYFMEHIEVKSAELWFSTPQLLNLYVYREGATKIRAALAITEQAQKEHQILNGTAGLSPISRTREAGSLIDIWQNDDPRKSRDNWLQPIKNRQSDMVPFTERVVRKLNRLLGKPPQSWVVPPVVERGFDLFTRIEQTPNPLSRVTLDRETDPLGMPRANLHWQLSPLDKRSIRKIYELIGQSVGKAGIARVKLMDYLTDENDLIWPEFTGGGFHHMGTTRMSGDAKHGVVDQNCQVHGIDNLFVAGSGCFPTGGAANPTLSLIALSLRLSDHVLERIQKVAI